MIIPASGRIVWFTPPTGPHLHMNRINRNAPLPAIVCHIWGERSVKRVVCRWVPYKIEQAKKHEGDK